MAQGFAQKEATSANLMQQANGRLTLTSGTPVTTSDVTAAGTVYWTPYKGNKIGLYNSTTSKWELFTFTERSVAVPATTSTPFDIFIYNNAGTLTLSTTNWTNDTTRATALTTQDGIYVKSGATNYRYLGTGRTTGTSGQCEVSFGGTTSQVGGKMFLWNYYNRVDVELNVIDTTNSWAYTTNSKRQANNASGNKVELIIGVKEDSITAQVVQNCYVVSNTIPAKSGIGIDTISAFSGLVGAVYNSGAFGLYGCMSSLYQGKLSVGYHYVAWVESGGDSTCVFVGDNGDGGGQQCGLTVKMNY